MEYLENINNAQMIMKKENQTWKAKNTYFLLSAATFLLFLKGFMHVTTQAFKKMHFILFPEYIL